MQTIQKPDKETWNQFIASNSTPSSFLQSWEWGEFQRSLGNKIHRIAAVREDGAYQAAAQTIVRPLYFGKTYLEVAKGPITKISNSKFQIPNLILGELEKIGQQEKAVLVRVNPPYESHNLQLTTYKLTTPEILMRQTEPPDTILVDLTKSEDELMAKMHEKSRYNIRLAVKRGVKVYDKTGDRAAFEKFLELIQETSKRDGITVWPKERFEKFRERFMNLPSPGDGEGSRKRSEIPRAILLTGEYENKTLAAAIVMLFGDSGTYLYAASSAEQRNANVPSLVLWEAIRQAKSAGKKYYDMWGIAPNGAGENHPWTGITRFKSRYVTIGETGLEKHYLGTLDLVLNKKVHTIFKIAKKIRGPL